MLMKNVELLRIFCLCIGPYQFVQVCILSICVYIHACALLMHYGQTTPRFHPRPATAGGGAVHVTRQMVSYCNTINDAPTHR